MMMMMFVTVPDPDFEIRGGGGWSSRLLDKGRGDWSRKKIFPGPSGLSLV